MVRVFVTTLAVVCFALDSVSASRKNEPLTATRKEKDVPLSTPLVSVLADPPVPQSTSARVETSTTPGPLSEDLDVMHEPMDEQEEQVRATAPAKAVVENRSSVMEILAGAPDATDTQEVPYYFLNFPISIKFTGTNSGQSNLVLMDRFEIVQVPTNIVYIYPVVLFLGYLLIWGICCMRSNRTGMSFRLICEAAACFMCLWADLATKHKVITATRAWSYIILMMILMTTWNIATIFADNDATWYVFQSLVILVWLMFSIERTFVRKFYRRTVDPMAGDHYCSDCVANLCCGQFAALQEAQFMAEVSTEDTLAKSGDKSGKW